MTLLTLRIVAMLAMMQDMHARGGGVAATRPVAAPARSPNTWRVAAQGLRDFAVSPNGRIVAFVKVPSKESVVARFGDAAESDHHLVEVTTVWLASAPDWRPRQLFGVDQSLHQFSQLQWSPDGHYLAIVATRGTRSQVILWDRHRATVSATSPCVSMGAYDDIDRDRTLIRFAWIGHGRGLLLGEPCDADPSIPPVFVGAQLVGIRDHLRGWNVRAGGRGPSVSVLHGGVPSDSMPIATSDLWLLDAHAGTAHRVTSGPYNAFVVSPMHTQVALFAGFGAPTPDPDHPVPFVARPMIYRLAIVDLNGSGEPVTLPTTALVMPGSVRWSPDGRAIGVVEHDWPAHGTPCAAAFDWRVPRPITRVCGPMVAIDSVPTSADFDASAGNPAAHGIAWLGDGRFAARLCEPRRAQNAGTTRCDWTAVDTGNVLGPRLTATLPQVPDTLWTLGRRTFVVARGRLLELDRYDSSDTIGFSDPLPGFRDSVRSLVAISSDTANPAFTLVTGSDVERRWVIVHEHARTVDTAATLRGLNRAVAREPHSDGIGYPAIDPAHGTSVLVARDTVQSSWFVVSRPPGRNNAFVAHVIGTAEAPARFRPFAVERQVRYKGENGNSLVARVTLPLDYVPGRRYPMVVTVYPSPDIDSTWDAGDHLTKNYAGWAEYGYIELFPSQPAQYGPGHPELAISQVTMNVLPAIDELVRLGLADSARVGIMGHSFGGYTVYTLLTQTKRFRAAIAEAAPANALGSWGVFMPYNRYSQRAEFDQAPYWYMETAQLNLPFVPWRRPDLYIKDSPFFAVDEITTPVMIVQGDQDFIPMAESEQMFNALRRLGRRVDFVRYWGEEHGLEGYWNMRDKQQRELAWFAHFLGGSTVPVSETQGAQQAPGK